MVGRELDPQAMSDGPVRLAMLACRQIALETGSGPSSALIVLQRLRASVNRGKLTQARLNDVAALVDDAEDAGVPPVEELVAELAPVIRRRMQSKAILEAHAEFARGGDFGSVEKLLERAKVVGQSAGVEQIRAGAAGFDSIAALAHLGRLPTGIIELDLAIKGGMLRGKLGVVIGDSGAGKSIFLDTQACEAVRGGLHVAVATLEISKEETFARCAAGLTGVATGLILESPDHRKVAAERLEQMLPHIGMLHVGEFAPHATPVREVVDWVEELEQAQGSAIHVVVVDYGDKLHEPKARQDDEYVAMRYVFEGMRRDGARAKNQWWWTGSQAKRQKDPGKRLLDLHSAADSMHKVRVADLVVTLNPREEGLIYFVAKNRGGPAGLAVGPLPTDFERGRITPVAREWGPW